MEISQATLDELAAALPNMTDEEAAEALALLQGEFSVAVEKPIMTPAEFRSQLRIIANGTIRLFDQVAEPWQLADMTVLDAAWMGAIGAGPIPHVRRAWLERPKGHSKTDDTAGYVCWALTCSQKRIEGVVGAEDLDQARLLRDHIDDMVKMNGFPLKVGRAEVVNPATGSKLTVLTSDAPSTHGIAPEFVIADELCHWRSDAMWNTLYSSHGKKEWSVFVVLTNAGWINSWAWKARQAVMADTDWHFSRLDGPCASWISRESLDSQRKHLTKPSEFERLFLNQWVSGTGKGIDDALVTAAVNHDLQPAVGTEPGMVYCAGLDIGVHRHRSSLYVVGLWRQRRTRALEDDEHDGPKIPDGLLRLAYGHNWMPKPNDPVKLDAQVEPEVERVAKLFRCPVFYDPHNMPQMAERLERRGVRMVPVTQSLKNQQTMAAVLIEAYSEGRFSMYPDPMLLGDVRAATIVDRANGFKLESPDDERGHGDALTALQHAMFGLTEAPPAPGSARNRLAEFLGIPLGDEQPKAKKAAGGQVRCSACGSMVDGLAGGGVCAACERTFVVQRADL